MLITGLSLFVFGLICFLALFFFPAPWTAKLALIPSVTLCWYHAYTLLMPIIHAKKCTEVTEGTILSIKANGATLGGPHQPLYKASIQYLDTEKVFNNLSPYFIHNYQPGDTIEVKFNPKKPSIAVVEE